VEIITKLVDTIYSNREKHSSVLCGVLNPSLGERFQTERSAVVGFVVFCCCVALKDIYHMIEIHKFLK
jgi:hypothetical protein